jgi:hypothetical protein
VIGLEARAETLRMFWTRCLSLMLVSCSDDGMSGRIANLPTLRRGLDFVSSF